ncbi:MAG: winged helix-turn-helix transcriptional regulator [Promethearchaeota archaeon]
MTEEEGDFKFEGIIREIEKSFIKLIVDIGNLGPLSPKFTEIFGYLMIHGHLTQLQLSELTGFSIGTVSSNLNQMLSLGLVRKELIPKTRTYKYIFLGDKGNLELQASFMKTEVVNSVIAFFEQKLNELSNYDDEKGFTLLEERINAMLIFFHWHKKAIERKFAILKNELKHT